MHLGAASRIGEACPLGAAPIQPETGRVDQINRIAQRPAQMPVGLADRQREQLAEHRRRAVRIGVRQGRAMRRARPQMVQPSLMAAQPGDDLAQAGGSRQLAVQQRDQLALGGQPAHPCVGPVLLDQPIESQPRNMTVTGGVTVDVALDGEDRIDAAHRLQRHRGLAGIGDDEELAPAVAPARRFGDWSGFALAVVEIAKPGIGVGLEDPRIAGKVPSRMLAVPVARVIEDCGRRVRPGKRPIVAHIRRTLGFT